MTRLIPVFALSLFASGCSGGAEDGNADGNPSIPDASIPTAPDADTRAGDTFTATWGPYDIDPGIEDTKCMIRRLDNDRSIHVGEIHNVLGNISHHFIVYRIDEGEVSTEPFDCEPFADTLDPTKGAPLMVTQKADETLTLPDGVGFTFVPNQLVRLELHYLNATADPQTVTVTSTFTTVSDADFEHEADFLFVGNPDIDLAPGTSTLGPVYMPLPPELEGSNIFGITGHTHQWGTDVSVAVQEGAGGSPSMIYDIENYNWEEPDTVMLEPMVTIGQETGFNFSCSWDNQSGSQVGFGEGADDEMCFFWAYYYPSKGAKVCVHTDQYPDIATDLCCPGDNPLCAFVGQIL